MCQPGKGKQPGRYLMKRAMILADAAMFSVAPSSGSARAGGEL
jgi:hypothetical protein